MRKPATLRTILPPILAVGVGATLLAAYVAPFYGAFDRDTGHSESEITVENFDMPEDMPPERLPSGLLAGEADKPQLENPLPDAAGKLQDAPLERIAPRAPLSELSLASSVPEPTVSIAADGNGEEELFHRPVAMAAGRLMVDDRTIELQDIEIVEPDATCSDVGGEDWQCGMQARTAFRSWLRGRAINCNMAGIDPNATLIRTSCTLAGTDLARWLVENGWARATFSGPYADSQVQAEKKLLGIFGRKPASVLSPSVEGAAEDVMAPILPFETSAPEITQPQDSEPQILNPPEPVTPAAGGLPFPPSP